MALLAALDISDPPEVWSALGFLVDGDEVVVDGVRQRLGRGGKGLTAWSLWGVELPVGATDIDGLPTSVDSGEPPPPVTPAHPNGVTGLDHVVVFTPDLDRSVAAFESVGLELRRTRESDSYGAPMRQAFFRLGPVILEVVGGADATGDGPARFFGLAWTCADLDASAQWFGETLHPPKGAVQAGRRISTLDRAAGSRVAMAFMSPQPD